MKKFTLLILISLTISFGFAQDTLTIELLTDGYANETQWGVFDSSGTLIGQNGTLAAYTLVSTDFPVSPTECYQFVIIDSYGDGIAGYNGSPQGYVNILYNGVHIGGITTAESNFGSRLDIFGLGNGCPNIDANLVRINNPPFSGVGNINISCMVQNKGLNNLTSFDINYQIGSGTTITQAVTGVNMAIGEFDNYTFTTPWASNTPGLYNLRVWVSNVNGVGVDENTSNDSQDLDISIASQTTNNAPMFEIFTSSTCGPCAPFNTNALNPFMASHSDINVIKYQMSWPNPGDNYYTAEGGVRRAYYNVGGIPQQFIGGTKYTASAAGVNNGYNVEVGKDAFFTVNAIHAFRSSDNSVDIEVDIDPYVSGEFIVYAVVIEGTTTQNTGNNGETSFEHVMMKMVPDASGTTTMFTDGVHKNLTLNASMVGTNVEEISDLQVIVFIQHDTTKTIMQSKSSTADNTAAVDNLIFNKVEIFPNPTTGILNIKTDRVLDIKISDMLGREIYANNNVLDNSTIDLSNMEKGVYMVSVTNGIQTETKKIILE